MPLSMEYLENSGGLQGALGLSGAVAAGIQAVVQGGEASCSASAAMPSITSGQLFSSPIAAAT